MKSTPSRSRINPPEVKPAMHGRTRFTVRPLRKDDWPIIEQLFGPNGACGGCWCMVWRIPLGGKSWDERKGRPNRDAFRKLVESGKALGCLAFCGDEPAGWCSLGARADFPKLERARSLQTNWDEKTWSVVCFYIPAKWRHRGVATALLRAAVAYARSRGAGSLEGYPVMPSKVFGRDIPAAFAWTGVHTLFERAGFRALDRPDQKRIVYVKRFRSSAPKKV